MSTCRAKRIRQGPCHRLRLILLDLIAVVFRPRIGKALCRAQRCIRALPAAKALLTLLFVAGSSFCVAAQIRSSQSQTEQPSIGAVKATYEAYLRAWKDKDISARDHLLSDDYQAVNFQGIVSSKANEIATAMEDRTYNSLRGEAMSVSLFGDCAIASGLIEASWKDEHENPQTSTFRFLAVLEKQKGDWKLMATQSTKFNRPAQPWKK